MHHKGHAHGAPGLLARRHNEYDQGKSLIITIKSQPLSMTTH